MELGKRGGFSLVEATLTVGLCALAIFVLLGTVHYTLVLNQQSTSRLIALNDARRIAERIRTTADSYGLIGANSVTSPATPWSSHLSNQLTDEAVNVTLSGNDPLDVVVRITWLDKDRTQTLDLTTKVTR